VMVVAGTLGKHLCKQWRRRARSQRKQVSEAKRLWGSRLGSGGEAGGGRGARERNAQEAELAGAVSALMAKFSSQDDASGQPPDDLTSEKGGSSCHSIGDDSNNNNNRGSPKKPSKRKRRQMKRVSSSHWRIVARSTNTCGATQT